MPSYVFKDDYTAFIDAIASRRRDIKNWTVLLIQLAVQGNSNQSCIDEMIQALEFQFQGSEVLILEIKQQNKVFVVTKNKDRKAMSLVEKTVSEILDEGALEGVMGIPLSQGIEYMCRILKKVIPKGDSHGNTGLIRLSRPSNAFLIYDDDMMAVNRLRRILQSMGYVATAQDEEEFIALYRQYAPNAAFVSTSGGNAQSSYIVKRVKQEIDPFAHLILVAENPTIEAVMQSRKLGANGFIAKPLAHDVVFKQLTQMRNFVTHATAPGVQLI